MSVGEENYYLSIVALQYFVIVYIVIFTELTRVSIYRHNIILATRLVFVCKSVGNPRLGR